MSTFHFLNVRQGDCQIIQHNSGRVTMIDICNGNAARRTMATHLFEPQTLESIGVSRNFGMCDKPTQPLDYLQDLGVSNVWRFILSHPDMDHMDGLDPLFSGLNVCNFWDSGVRRNKPEFGIFGRYQEEDWDRYESIINGRTPGLNVLLKQHGAQFPYANQPPESCVLMGCADSEDLAYDAYGDYIRITNNQAGNVVAECTTAGIDVYVENDEFAKQWSDYTPTRWFKGYQFIGSIPRS